METSKTYQFTCMNPKAAFYILGGFLGMFVWFFFIDVFPFWLLIPLIFAMPVIGVILAVRKNKIQEEIKLYDTYLVSAHYGKIAFKDITQAEPRAIKNISLKLYLAHRRAISWTAKSLDSKNKDTKALASFIQGLNAAFDQYVKSKETTEDKATLTTETKKDAIQESEEKTVLQGLEKAQNRKGIGKKTAIPAGILTLVIALAIYLQNDVLPKWEQQRNRKEMAPIREAVSQHMSHTASLKDSVRKVVNAYTEANGPYLLWSNDTTAQLRYVPIIKLHQSKTGIVSLVNTELSDQLETFLAKPDSVPWAMAMENERTSFYLKTRWPAFKDTAATYFYLGLEDATVKVPNPNYDPRFSGHRIPDSVSFQSVIPILLHNKQFMKKEIDLNMAVPLKFLQKHSSTTHFYVAARVGEGRMTQALFRRILTIIQTNMVHQFKIDTVGYQLNVFNKKDTDRRSNPQAEQ